MVRTKWRPRQLDACKDNSNLHINVESNANIIGGCKFEFKPRIILKARRRVLEKDISRNYAEPNKLFDYSYRNMQQLEKSKRIASSNNRYKKQQTLHKIISTFHVGSRIFDFLFGI